VVFSAFECPPIDTQMLYLGRKRVKTSSQATRSYNPSKNIHLLWLSFYRIRLRVVDVIPQSRLVSSCSDDNISTEPATTKSPLATCWLRPPPPLGVLGPARLGSRPARRDPAHLANVFSHQRKWLRAWFNFGILKCRCLRHLRIILSFFLKVKWRSQENLTNSKCPLFFVSLRVYKGMSRDEF